MVILNNKSQPASKILSQVIYFEGIAQSQLTIIAQSTVVKKYQAEQVLFLEGEICNGFYFVETGWIKLIKMSTSGREQIVRFVGAGETFNEMSIFANAKNAVTAIILEPSQVWFIPRDSIMHLMETDYQFNQLITQNLARRIQHLLTLVEDLSLRSVEARLAHYLYQNAEATLVDRPAWASQAELAGYVGTVPDVLNRVLRKLAEDGLIEVKRHQIKILDPEGIKARALIS